MCFGAGLVLQPLGSFRIRLPLTVLLRLLLKLLLLLRAAFLPLALRGRWFPRRGTFAGLLLN